MSWGLFWPDAHRCQILVKTKYPLELYSVSKKADIKLRSKALLN